MAKTRTAKLSVMLPSGRRASDGTLGSLGHYYPFHLHHLHHHHCLEKEVSMPDPDYKALCAELVTDINEWMVGTDHRPMSSVELVDRARAALAQPESAVVPVSVSDALIKAECALSDVAEGEPECDDGDPSQWAEQRCAETLAIIRPVMKLHKIRTSEWPPQPMPTPANNTGGKD
jgi:hypothetical protein